MMQVNFSLNFLKFRGCVLSIEVTVSFEWIKRGGDCEVERAKIMGQDGGMAAVDTILGLKRKKKNRQTVA